MNIYNIIIMYIGFKDFIHIFTFLCAAPQTNGAAATMFYVLTKQNICYYAHGNKR